MLALPLVTCWAIQDEDARGRLPPRITYDRVLAAQSAYGCVYAAYRLTPETVSRLKRDGLGALSGSGPRKDRRRYGAWRETPLLLTGDGVEARLDARSAAFPLFALGARRGCNNRRGPVDVTRLLSRPGAYFSMSENHEGLIVISPAEGVAAFVYFG